VSADTVNAGAFELERLVEHPPESSDGAVGCGTKIRIR